MALPNKEKYEQKKIDNLIQYLRLYYDKGQPIDYEILVDGFKAVRRTNDPDMFTMFENFVTADTRSIEVLLFTGSSNNNEKRIFYFGDQPKEGLSGLDVKNIVDEEVQRKLREKEYETLKDDNKKLQQHIADLESEVEELEKQNARLEMKQSPLNSFLGDIGSSLVESFVKRNPKLMAAFPGGEALAGLLQSITRRNRQNNNYRSLVTSSQRSQSCYNERGRSGRDSVCQSNKITIHQRTNLKECFTFFKPWLMTRVRLT
ncbi:MAG: hypothetical protein U0V64_16130 [Cyclobacteriaceae bacterium]